MTPWSVSPRAGMSSSAARAASLSILQAPSSSEYSLWTCRWATVPLTWPSCQRDQMATRGEPATCGYGDGVIWLLRHGDAEEGSGDDSARRLTAKGERQARAAGAGLATLGVEF